MNIILHSRVMKVGLLKAHHSSCFFNPKGTNLERWLVLLDDVRRVFQGTQDQETTILDITVLQYYSTVVIL